MNTDHETSKQMNEIIGNPVTSKKTIEILPKKIRSSSTDNFSPESPKTIDLSMSDYTNQTIFHGKNTSLLQRQRHGIAMGLS